MGKDAHTEQRTQCNCNSGARYFPHTARGTRAQGGVSANHQEYRPNDYGSPAGQLGDLATAGSAADQHPKSDADRMQDRGRCNEPKTEQNA